MKISQDGILGFLLGAVVVIVTSHWGGRGLVLAALLVAAWIASVYALGALVLLLVVPARIVRNLVLSRPWRERIFDFGEDS